MEVVDFEPLYEGRRTGAVPVDDVAVIAVEVEVEGEGAVSFPARNSSPSLLPSQSRSPPCGDTSPPALPPPNIKSSAGEADEGGGGVGVADLSIFSPLERSFSVRSLVSTPRNPAPLISPVILKVGLIAGLCFLRGLGLSSSLAFADRLLPVVVEEAVAEGVPEEVGREDDGVAFARIGLLALPPAPAV